MGRLKSAAKRSKWLVCAANVIDDQRARLAARNGAVASTSGSTHGDFSLDESLAYIDAVFGDYLAYGELGPDELRGAAVLELGPGDNFGVALRFLAAGAARVVAMDKFASVRDRDQQRAIYFALLERMGPEERDRAEAAIDLEALRFEPGRLRVIEGVAVERAAAALGDERFDLIVSRAVLEHLYDLDAAFAAMDSLLRPGGAMLHKVDFRDHGMFTDGGMHPLTFLTVPDRLYTLMSRNSGRPNRRLADFYRAKLTELGYDGRILVTKPVDGDELDPHPDRIEVQPRTRDLIEEVRPRLLPRYRALSDADLATAGIFLVARKPAA
jgi:SAM-dependent methyltransferase